MDPVIAFWETIRARPDFWGFVCIPFVAAIVTWAHVWMALQMVFYPLEFVGFCKPWFGWQGIVPSKARKMSGIVVDQVINKLGSVSDFLRLMEPAAIGRHVIRSIDPRIEEYVDQVMHQHHEVFWENLPNLVKQRVYSHARKQLPSIMDGLVTELIERIEDLIDVREMVCSQMENDKALVVRMFQEVGHAEFAFIVRISFWIGLTFGFVQMILWYFFPVHAMLPLFAAILGLATNWLALTMVFRPVDPVKVGPFVFQGVFLRRQGEVSEKFAEMTAHEMLTVGHFMNEVFHGTHADQTNRLVRKHLTPLVEDVGLRTAAQLSIGPKAFAELKDTLANHASQLAMEPLQENDFNKQRAAVLQMVFAQRMKALTPGEFQSLLRPAFQEDEWILLVLGAVTGAVAGWLQLITGFA